MTLLGKKVLIFAGPDFEDRELFYPLYRFREAGAEVKVAGLGEPVYRGKHGLPVAVDGRYDELYREPWDVVVIPGGWAPDKIRLDDAALDIVRRAVKDNRIVTAICHGGWVLVSAGVVAGRKLTSYPAIKDDLIHAGANWVDAEVVVDGRLVTSRQPDDLPAFCRETLKLLEKVAVPV